jgi:hypothetical protein
VDPRAGLDDLEKRKFLTLPGLELRPLGRPTLPVDIGEYSVSSPYCCGREKISRPLPGIETTFFGPATHHILWRFINVPVESVVL